MHRAVPELLSARAGGATSYGSPSNLDAEVWRDPLGQELAYVTVAGDRARVQIAGIGAFEFSVTDGPVELERESAVSPEHAREMFWRYVLPAVLYIRGHEVLHSSAVVVSGDVYALCGDSESGKSTLARGLARRGHATFADDAVAFEIRGNSAIGIPLPFQMRLRPGSAQYFREESVLLDPHPDGYGEPGVSLPRIAAIFELEQVPPSSMHPVVDVARVPAGDAFVQVLRHAYMSRPDQQRKQLMVRQYLKLCTHVPVVRVRYQRGLDHLEETLDWIEQTLSEIGAGVMG